MTVAFIRATLLAIVSISREVGIAYTLHSVHDHCAWAAYVGLLSFDEAADLEEGWDAQRARGGLS